MAYSKFHDLPLYLEWAPLGAIRPDAPIGEAKSNADVSITGKTVSEQLAMPLAEPEEEGDAEGTSLFVKNLSFGTKEESLRALFEVRI